MLGHDRHGRLAGRAGFGIVPEHPHRAGQPWDLEYRTPATAATIGIEDPSSFGTARRRS
jgi:hypothetical protein